MDKRAALFVGLVMLAGSIFAAPPGELSHLTAADEVGLNPFNPPLVSLNRNGKTNLADQGVGAWDLHGVILAGRASQVALNGRILGLGDDIGGFEVVAIDARQVVLAKDSVREVVSLDDQLEIADE